MSGLDGRRVLLVEDESLVAMLAEDMLLDMGCEVVVAMRLDRALAFVREQSFDLAVLDVNLGDTCSYPVADELLERLTPFVFATGYGRHGLDARYQNMLVVQKPYYVEQLKQQLQSAMTSKWLWKRQQPFQQANCACCDRFARGSAIQLLARGVG